MSHDHVEVELKFLVPASSREALAREMARAAATAASTTLVARYLDTPDGRIAQAGLAWRLRRDGRRWTQTLKVLGGHSLERFEHEVSRPGPTPDASQHAHTPAGDLLAATVRRAQEDGVDIGVRFETRMRRRLRRVRTRGALVEVAFDEGAIAAGESSIGVCEVEFELVSGSPAALLALAERWRKRFGLVIDPRGKADRGERLARSLATAPVRKAAKLDYDRDADARHAFGAVLDECLAHVLHNAIGLAAGDAHARVDHVHQMRVGIRRLRSALRCFDGWVPAAPDDLVDGLRAIFASLGASRDRDVLAGGVAKALARAGAPPLPLPPAADAADPAEVAQAGETQRMLLAWVAWRVAMVDADPVAGPPSDADAVEPAAAPPSDDALDLAHAAQRRLARWHRRIVAHEAAFDTLDDEALHALRKRIKRQRYAVEFFAPLLRRRSLARYLEPLAAIQERMGELNDLFVARASYQAAVEDEPQAWFALGWLAARIVEVRASAKGELAQLAQAEPPRRR